MTGEPQPDVTPPLVTPVDVEEFDPLAPWTITSSRALPRIPWMGPLVEDDVVLPNGVEATWVRYADDREGLTAFNTVQTVCFRPGPTGPEVLVLEQWSHGCQVLMTEFPAGGVDRGEPLEDAAVRECREEAGVRPRSVRRLGGHRSSPRKGGFWSHVFVGTDCVDDPLPGDETELLLPVWISVDALTDRIADGRFNNVYALAAWTLVLAHGAVPTA